ncbi:CheY chemotaxis protein or a CheY-like REC (receiver) domain [Roseomonas rosea]|uniref:CheY chemotaxis protein or a CheY-like REC (Receiver) domain n=1 Tax=Muricoccus roseus TaxID=198092 RepID=A0A1M6D6P4_9PROT|nr:response regulator [Roseomonas rosea]SHI68917.1 CheY chemotaxis protein or a CheY-like REC (receiver) domain [Roseomonas rosea]
MTVSKTEVELIGRRVLVVEDEFFIADDLAEALRGAGAEVIGPVPTRERALDMVAGTGMIDFAVLDINLGGEAGYAVAEALSERGVPFVIATGYARGALPPRFRDVPHWEKPLDADVLVSVLSSLVART